MFDLGWSEMLVIGVTALIVVGPKDLPVLFRNVGRFVGKMKGMAREFSRAMNDAAEGSGVNEMAKTFKSASNPMSSAMDGVKDAARDMTNWSPETGAKTRKTPKTDAPDPARDAQARKIEAAAARKAAERKARDAEVAMMEAEALEEGLNETPPPAGADKDSA